MKWLACCVAVLAVVGLVQCLTSSEEMVNLKVQMIKNYMRERQAISSLTTKVESLCPGYGSQFETALNKVEQCTNGIDEDTETMCSAVENHFERCSKPVVKIFEECLPEKSKDVPAFIIKAILSVSKYLCKTDGEHIFELSNPCVKSQNYRTQRCLRKLESKFQQYSSTFPTKDEICQFTSSFKGCFESHLLHSCGHVKTRESFLNVYNALQSPCQSSGTENEVDMRKPIHEWVEEV
ncbi:uncharacterized protein LOC108908959 [Anoplophora glabripennis]|uniref:27 kDa hemolymph protein n=1 Tax=Anoplophora glabripennis TaxID=217634 RepID=A0A2C9PGD3_ANOGL|nr:uncharacterized protein LOC108908959 [Anoplophora glabripennis]ATL75738.1 hypothetical protein [Anoplophora glabripennis]